MLAVALVVGISAAGARPAHLLLAVAAVSAYLFSVPALDWLRSRRREHLVPAVAYGAVLAGSGVALLLAEPALVPLVLAVAAAGGASIAFALAGRPRSVVVSLVEVAQAIALVPAAAIIAGSLDEPATGRATIVAGLYLAGSVLLVRSMIRERGNTWFLAASIGFHAVGVVVAALELPWPYVVFAIGLLLRAILLPVAQARLASGPRRLRPIHIGIVEIVASAALVVLAVGIGF